MPVAGLRGTGDFGTDERPKSFRETILRRNPNGTAPIFALTSKAGKRTVRDPEFSWWDEPNDIVRLQVNGALIAGDQLITVDSADPTTSTPDVVWGKAGHLKEGDLLMVDPTADSATFNFEVVEVTAVLSDTQFTVKRGRSGTTAGVIADNAFLTLIGSAYAEGTGVPPPTTRNPMKYTNYTQIFKDTYELTGTLNATDLRTGEPWSNDKKRKTWDHSAKIEASILFGRPHETTGENGKPLRYMGGLRHYIPNFVFGSAVTRTTFFDQIAPVFNFNTGAGDTRIAFAGNSALTALQNVFESGMTRQIQSGGAKVYGMVLTEFETPQGRLLVRSHPILSRHTLFTKSMFICDFDAIKYVTLPGRDTDTKDDVQAKDEDVRRGFIQTECSLEVLYGGLTMRYLGNISAT